MAVSRGHTPPVNLKERIAALQQRNASPNTHQSAQAAPRGMPSVMGAGGLRDKIAKFEEKGGVPVPRGSFGMGAAPMQTENAPGKKRGELYGNRVTGLGLGLPGRPGGAGGTSSSASASRSGSPLPPRSDSSLSTSTSPSSSPLPGPRKRCISTGTSLSSSSAAPSPASFSTDMPMPPLPPNFAMPGSAPRRNSLAVDFGSGRRVMSAKHSEPLLDLVDASSPVTVPDKTVDSDGQSPPSPEPEDPVAEATPSQVEVEESSQPAEPEAVDASPPVPEHPPSTETIEEPHPNPESAQMPLPVQVEEPQPSSSETPNPSDLPPFVVDQPSSAQTDSNLDDPPLEDPPEATQNHPFPVCDASQDISQPVVAEEIPSKDGLSDYELVPRSDNSLPPSFPPSPASSAPPSAPSAPSGAPSSPDAPAEAVVTDLLPSPLEEEEISVVTSRDSVDIIPVPLPSPTDPVLPSTSTPDLTTEARPQKQPTFKAVVHRKVTEVPVAPISSSVTSFAVPQATKRRLAVSNNVTELSPNPGYGDLVVLLEEAALLEQRLNQGDGAGSKSKSKELLSATTPTNATFQPEPRHPPPSTFIERAPMPSLDSGSLSVRSMSIPSIREPLIDGEIPEGDETDGRSLASTTFSQRSPSHRKYLSNIYRLTGRRSSAYMPGAYPRDSMSVSSEDSSPVATPSSDSGKRKGFGIAWPSASPKKGGPNVGRSSSFADKLFNRTRTKSNVSTTDQVLERNSLYQSSQPSLTLPFPPELPSSPEVHHRHHYPYQHQHQHHHYHPEPLVASVQVPGARSRSSSWVSSPGGDSNAEFSPASSPLDNDIFDAFPSVPQTLPPGFRLDVVENLGGSMGHASTLPVKGRKQLDERLFA